MAEKKKQSGDEEVFNRKRMRKIRKSMMMTQAKLAKLCNCATNTIGRIERGELVPGLELATKIAKKLKVSLDELFISAPVRQIGDVDKFSLVRHQLWEKLIEIPEDQVPLFLSAIEFMLNLFSTLRNKPSRK